MSSLYKDKVDSLILQCSLGGVSVNSIPQRPVKTDTIVNLVKFKCYKVGGRIMSIIIFILIGLLIVYLSRLNFRKIYLSLKLPGPMPLPFVGNGLLFVNKTPAG